MFRYCPCFLGWKICSYRRGRNGKSCKESRWRNAMVKHKDDWFSEDAVAYDTISYSVTHLFREKGNYRRTLHFSFWSRLLFVKDVIPKLLILYIRPNVLSRDFSNLCSKIRSGVNAGSARNFLYLKNKKQVQKPLVIKRTHFYVELKIFEYYGLTQVSYKNMYSQRVVF